MNPFSVVMIKKADIVLIVCFCIAAVCFPFVFTAGAQVGGFARVRYNGVVYRELPLSVSSASALDITTAEGERINTVAIRDGKARMVFASCPDGLCLEQGSIQYTNETIVCLPHKVTVEIIGGAPGALDGVAR